MNYALLEYYEKFGELPDISQMLADYDDDIFQALMISAVYEGVPLKREKIKEAYKNIVDIVDYDENDLEKIMYEEKDIIDLLVKYGFKENEIKKFMNDLHKRNEKIEEEDDFFDKEDNYFGKIEDLKKTEEGKDLIIKAPKMSKSELESELEDPVIKEAIIKLTQRH
jgi:hypothetical protein